MFPMRCKIWEKHKNAVQIYENADIEQIQEDIIHKLLNHDWGTTKPKGDSQGTVSVIVA